MHASFCGGGRRPCGTGGTVFLAYLEHLGSRRSLRLRSLSQCRRARVRVRRGSRVKMASRRPRPSVWCCGARSLCAQCRGLGFSLSVRPPHTGAACNNIFIPSFNKRVDYVHPPTCRTRCLAWAIKCAPRAGSLRALERSTQVRFAQGGRVATTARCPVLPLLCAATAQSHHIHARHMRQARSTSHSSSGKQTPSLPHTHTS